MDLLNSYGDGEGSDNEAGTSGQDDVAPAGGRRALVISSAAPAVDTTGLVLHESKAVDALSIRHYADPKARSTKYNIPFEDMHAPLMGPAHPYTRDGMAAGQRNHRSGHVEDTHMHPYAFDQQYHTYHSMGTAAAPSGNGLVYDQKSFQPERPEADLFAASAKRRKTEAEKAETAGRKAEAAALEGVMPTVPYTLHQRQPWATKEVKTVELSEEQKEYMAKVEAERQENAAASVATKGPTSFFHGKELTDYQGRSWMAPPREQKKESDYTYLPKKWVHTWSGHTKGVNAVRFFPGTGNLLLSAGLDGKVKIWDVYNNRKCMRTYLGHSQGVRDVQFNTDGSRFVSTGYDKKVHIWDTETGQVLRTFSTGKVYYVAKFHPGHQNVLMAGCSDKKIYQWDMDTGDLVQEYNYHLGAVNTITFLDNGARFITTSDDKTIRVWEYGIPVQIKYIADPSMHSVPSVSLHPKLTHFIGQSMDNQVITYACKDKIKQMKNKTFKGHNTAGYACEVNFSPDAKFVMSGDSEGRAFFWEWSAPQKIVRTIKAHDGVCIGCAWNPMEASKVVTCGWDGLIKLWD